MVRNAAFSSSATPGKAPNQSCRSVLTLLRRLPGARGVPPTLSGLQHFRLNTFLSAATELLFVYMPRPLKKAFPWLCNGSTAPYVPTAPCVPTVATQAQLSPVLLFDPERDRPDASCTCCTARLGRETGFKRTMRNK